MTLVRLRWFPSAVGEFLAPANFYSTLRIANTRKSKQFAAFASVRGLLVD